jgi:hypothetical protein
MAQSEENVFPIIDRRTPVLDRIRKRRNSEGLAESLGREIGQSIMEDDEMLLQRKRTEAVEGFRRGLAEELGVSTDDINEDASADIGEMIAGLRMEDVLTDEALQELGIGQQEVHQGIEEADEGEEEDSEPDF